MSRTLGLSPPFAFVVACAFALPALADVSSERLARLDEFLHACVDEGKIPGAVLQITHDGRTVYHRAAGLRDRDANAPMRTDTIFRIASMSKAVVSAAVMMLDERGALLTTQPVGDYLPEYATTSVAVAGADGGYEIVDATRPITIRDLLTHTAGVGYGYGPAAELWQAAGLQHWYFGYRDEPIRETVRRIGGLPMDAHPGERWVYGYNTDILGALVEVASGTALDEYLETEIFSPLGMTDTSFYLPPAKADRLAMVYSRTPEGHLVLPDANTPFHGQGHYLAGPRRSFSGGAGLLSTTADYTRFLEAIRHGGKPILSRRSVELMTTDTLREAAAFPGGGVGLGFGTVSDPVLRGLRGSPGEFFWGGAYHTSYWVDPDEKLTVVYMTQVIPAPGLDDFSRVRELVYEAVE